MNSIAFSKFRLEILDRLDEIIMERRKAENRVLSLKLEMAECRKLLYRIEANRELTEGNLSQHYGLFSLKFQEDCFFYGYEYAWEKLDIHKECALFPLVPQSHYSKGGQS